jgi:NAD(P)-dependent dehydrogenase (short-subunit alcohol dehydrogenase family)
MGALDNRVAIVTGAGRGLGREHALLLAREGAKVVVNDLGGAADGEGSDQTPAQEVVAEIESLGGEAVANGDDVTSWTGGEALVRCAVDAFGDLDVLVNNAGILRDRMLVNMSEAEFDSVVAVHLKGHFCTARHAAAYWRERSRAGVERPRAIVNTTSGSGLYGMPGQTNYAAAKSGIATMTLVWAQELGRYGVKVNAVSPVARTRLTESSPGIQFMAEDDGGLDFYDPANVSPAVGYLASAECAFSGHVLYTQGGQVTLMRGWGAGTVLERPERWTVEALAAALAPHTGEPALGDWSALKARRGEGETAEATA